MSRYQGSIQQTEDGTVLRTHVDDLVLKIRHKDDEKLLKATDHVVIVNGRRAGHTLTVHDWRVVEKPAKPKPKEKLE